MEGSWDFVVKLWILALGCSLAFFLLGLFGGRMLLFLMFTSGGTSYADFSEVCEQHISLIFSTSFLRVRLLLLSYSLLAMSALLSAFSF
jgi:hypothetical protein